MRNELIIYGYKVKYLEGSLILWQLNKILNSSLILPIFSFDMGFLIECQAHSPSCGVSLNFNCLLFKKNKHCVCFQETAEAWEGIRIPWIWMEMETYGENFICGLWELNLSPLQNHSRKLSAYWAISPSCFQFLKFNELGWAWCCMPLIPALWRHRQVDLWVLCQAHIHTRRAYVERLSQKAKKNELINF